MKAKVLNGKIELTAIADEKELLRQFNNWFLSKFEEETYSVFESTIPDVDGYLTEEEFKENVDEFISDIKKACTKESLEGAVRVFKKKKNGTFYRNRKLVESSYNNSIYFSEWHNSWKSLELRFSPINDYTLELNIVEVVSTPA